MPLTYDIDADRQLMTVTGADRLGLDDVMEHQRQVSEDDRITQGLRVLVDLRGLTGLDLAGREVLKLAQTRGDFPVLGTYGPTAVVATDPIMVGMTRMYMLSRRKYIQPMAVFPTTEEALAWLERGSPLPVSKGAATGLTGSPDGGRDEDYSLARRSRRTGTTSPSSTTLRCTFRTHSS